MKTKLNLLAACAAILTVLLGLAAGCTNDGSAEPSLCTTCQALVVDPSPGQAPCANACTESFECVVADSGDACTLEDVGNDVQCICEPLEIEVEDEVCDDGADNDGDGDLDCDDNDCDADPACLPLPEEVCDDGVDNDEDGNVDCDDDDCAADPICAPPLPVEVCDDGVDNDEDGNVDCDDDDCAADPICAPPLPVEVCDDGVDNDEDGNVDCDDDDCAAFLACLPPENTEVCDDGVDNDDDGLVDVSDPDCAEQTVAAIGVYFGVESVVHIVTAAESWDGNIPSDFNLAISIDGDDAWAQVWIETSSFEVVGGGQGFVVYSPPHSVAPPAWPVAGGLPVSDGGSFAATPGNEVWFNIYIEGAM